MIWYYINYFWFLQRKDVSFGTWRGPAPPLNLQVDRAANEKQYNRVMELLGDEQGVFKLSILQSEDHRKTFQEREITRFPGFGLSLFANVCYFAVPCCAHCTLFGVTCDQACGLRLGAMGVVLDTYFHSVTCMQYTRPYRPYTFTYRYSQSYTGHTCFAASVSRV